MIPKRFIPKKRRIPKDLLKKKKQLMQVSSPNLEALLEGCEEFLAGEGTLFAAVDIISDINYTREDLQPFCSHLIKYECSENFKSLGKFLSVLVNKIIKKDEEIRLYLPGTHVKLYRVGMALRQGRLVIVGDVGDCTGAWMLDGELVIEGRSGLDTGYGMAGGKLYAKEIEGLSDNYNYNFGEIYEEGIKLRPKNDS